MLSVFTKPRLIGTAVAVGALAVLFSFSISTAHAGALDLGVNQVDQSIALASGDIRVIIARIIRIVLSLLGVIALLIVLWGGFQWMIAGGEEEKLIDAKRTLVNGAIGMVIVLSAWSITTFVLRAILKAYEAGAPSGIAGGPPPPLFCTSCNELGRGIDMHYPPRDADDVPRNTNIIITFKAPIRRDTIIAGWTDAGMPDDATDDPTALNTDAIRILTCDSNRSNCTSLPAASLANVRVAYTADRKTFVFDTPDLGSPTERIWHRIEVDDDLVRREDGTKALAEEYRWLFRTSTVLDLTPPVVLSTFPVGSPPIYARNVLSRVTFNEAVNPISTNFPMIEVRNGPEADAPIIPGEWSITNQYRTIEFVTAEQCGQNQCGEPMFCYPANAEVRTLVKAASLKNPPDGSQASLPYTGVVDVASNSLNDRGNDAVGGQLDDNVSWNFAVSLAVDVTGPTIDTIMPIRDEENVLPSASVEITAFELLSYSSINTGSVRLRPLPEHGFWFTTRARDLNTAGDFVDSTPAPDDLAPERTRVFLDHADFYKAPFGEASQMYVPALTIGLRDAFQNCFVPSTGPACTPTATAPYCCNGQASADSTCGGLTSF